MWCPVRRPLAYLLAPALAFAACDYQPKVAPHGTWPVEDTVTPVDVADVATDSVDDVAAEVDVGPEVVIVGNGLPCEVQRILVDNCQSCHGTTPTEDSPMSLVTWADLHQPTRLQPEVDVGTRSIARMQSTTNPMPPLPAAPLAADDIAVLAAWVQAGMPPGVCDDVPDDTFTGPTVCTTNQRWTRGDDGSSSMHPGRDCIGCHAAEDEGPRFYVAGTVYATGHEPNDCYGVPRATGVKVEVVDANGLAYSLATNAAGNFYLERRGSTPFAYPYTARVVDPDGNVRAMAAAQTDGDCNTCHTESGAEDAPGRIAAPR